MTAARNPKSTGKNGVDVGEKSAPAPATGIGPDDPARFYGCPGDPVAKFATLGPLLQGTRRVAVRMRFIAIADITGRDVRATVFHLRVKIGRVLYMPDFMKRIAYQVPPTVGIGGPWFAVAWHDNPKPIHYAGGQLEWSMVIDQTAIDRAETLAAQGDMERALATLGWL